MSFEKQICQKCDKLAYCVDTNSIGQDTIRQKWLCEYCFGWVKDNAQKKDKIRAIMIECGIEDLEPNL